MSAVCRQPRPVPDTAGPRHVSAPVVERLIAAGALLIGKTNLDQFATGLVGTRSPYGIPRNPFDPAYIPGGSSSGSAVAVSAGLVAFALGTDTAGSGRVPASFNNIVGLKPTRGLISTAGVVPACRSLDCVSIFALTVEDAAAVHRGRLRGRSRRSVFASRAGRVWRGRRHAATVCLWRSARCRARIFRRRGRPCPLRSRDRALGPDRRRGGHDRFRPVSRGRLTGLSRRMGGGAPGGDRRRHRRSPRDPAAGDPGDHRAWRDDPRHRRFPRFRPAGGGARAGCRGLAADRPAAGPDDRDHVHDRRDRGRSDRAQRNSRSVHQFRQPARPGRGGRSERFPAKWAAGRRDRCGAGIP